MHTLNARLFVLATIILSGCQTNQPSNLTTKPEPTIVTSLRSNGKGIPNGRTDAVAPYLNIIKLKTSSDPEYGYSYEKPIRTSTSSSKLHLLYLNSLRGPKGEVVEYERIGACCEFEDKSTPLGMGMLDVYQVKIDGSSDVIKLYVDIYRKGMPQLPIGFTARQ